MSKIYIHYGSDEFNPEKFKPIKNKLMSTKPEGGLWASPIDSPQNWKNWCETEKFHLEKLQKSFTLQLRPNAKVLYINYAERLDLLPKQKPLVGLEHFDNWDCLDFEKIAKKYDAIELSLSQETTRGQEYWKSLSYKLYGWDCDSILILNPKCIMEVK